MIRYCILVFSLLLFSACGQSDSPPTIPAPKTEKVILALGDSLTAGYGLPEIESYPSQLQMRLRAL